MQPVASTQNDDNNPLNPGKRRAGGFKLPFKENALQQQQQKRQSKWLFNPDAKDALVLNKAEKDQVPVVVDPYISRQGLLQHCSCQCKHNRIRGSAQFYHLSRCHLDYQFLCNAKEGYHNKSLRAYSA